MPAEARMPTGHSAPIRAVCRLIRQVAVHDSSVLILGESGTGKEVVARAIHDSSPRRSRPFVAINCGAISAELLESELFGHEKGSFTGAVSARRGRFELADGGTLLLDEALQRFAPARPASCVLTKLDEAASLGGVMSLLIRTRLAVAYLSEGQRIPEDLVPGRALALVVRALALARASNNVADEELLQRRFGGAAHVFA